MKQNILFALLVCFMMLFMPAVPVQSASIEVGAPEHFAASRYVAGDYFIFTAAAPENLRALMDSSSGKAKFSGYTKLQIDYKLDNGSWHFTKGWDAYGKTPNYVTLQFKENNNYIYGSRAGLPALFPDGKADFTAMATDKDYFKSHSITFRARFAIQPESSKETFFSDWSEAYIYSMNVKPDPDMLMSQAPSLLTADVKKNSGGQPYIVVTTGKLPGLTQDLHSMSGDSVWTEIWLKRGGDADFKKVNESFFSNEYIQFDAEDYFDKGMTDYSKAGYAVKVRYRIDLRAYPQAGRSDIIYSPFSNIVSQSMPAWSAASQWAAGELKKADEYDLIPPILKGADLTKPITREEFAALAVVLYEKTTGKAASAASPNPFTDTQNPEILKAFQLGITKGTSAVTFSPNELITREQVAAMLARAIRVMAPGGDFSTAGAPVFNDQKDISGWALEDVKFMSKIGVIKGTNGNFMPKAVTEAQKAAGYATSTREQAIAMGVRIFEQYKP